MTRSEFAYVDSADEQLSYLVARFGPQNTWSVVDQRIATDDQGRAVERTRLQTSGGAVEVEFREARPLALSEGDDGVRTDALEHVMEQASRFAAENPPHHPGSLPRFPVPVEHYQDAVGVPLPIMAVDDLGRRGLFAPPRMAVVSWETHEPIGVRDFPDFDPDNWPPRRLGDWPSPEVARLVPEALDATIKRFSACWSRVIDAWYRDAEPREDVLRSDGAEALRLRRILDPKSMEPVYRSMNPRFTEWLASRDGS